MPIFVLSFLKCFRGAFSPQHSSRRHNEALLAVQRVGIFASHPLAAIMLLYDLNPYLLCSLGMFLSYLCVV